MKKKIITDDEIYRHHLRFHCGQGCSCSQDWCLPDFEVCRGECGQGALGKKYDINKEIFK